MWTACKTLNYRVLVASSASERFNIPVRLPHTSQLKWKLIAPL